MTNSVSDQIAKARHHCFLSSPQLAEEFFNKISRLTPELLCWLKRFRFLNEPDAKDLIQDLHIDIWRKTPRFLGVEPLVNLSPKNSINELKEIFENNQNILKVRIKKHLRRRALDLLRSRARKIREVIFNVKIFMLSQLFFQWNNPRFRD